MIEAICDNCGTRAPAAFCLFKKAGIAALSKPTGWVGHWDGERMVWLACSDKCRRQLEDRDNLAAPVPR